MNLKNTQDLTNFLKQIMELENSVYTQERAIEESNNYMKENKPYYVEPKYHNPVKQNPQLKKIPEPSKPDYGDTDRLKIANKEQPKYILFGIIALVLGIFMCFFEF